MTIDSIRRQPYVGVSGVVSPEMQSDIELTADRIGLEDVERILALGVKAVHKTQFLDIENKYGPEWYPVGEHDFSTALWPRDGSSPSIAVAQTYLDVDYVADPTYRREFTSRIIQRGAPWIQGIQFDMLPWHADAQMIGFLEDVKNESGLPIFLQCHKNAMEELGPKGAVKKLGEFAGSLDYILFDASHGTGTRLDAARLDPFVEEAYGSTALESVGISIAGGLDATAIREDLPELVAKYPDLSWDAEGKLHPVNQRGRRPLDISVVNDYLISSVDVLQSASKTD